MSNHTPQEIELAREKLAEAEQELAEAQAEGESSKVIASCKEAIRVRRMRVTRMESGK